MSYENIGKNFAIVHYYFARYINMNYKNKTILCNGRDCFITYIILKHIFKNKNVRYLKTSRKVLFNTAWNTDYAINSEENRFIYESIIYGRYKNVYELLRYISIAGNPKCSYIEILSKVSEAGFKDIYEDIKPFQENHIEIQNKIKKLVNSLQDILYYIVKPEHELEAKEHFKNKVKNNYVFADVGWNSTTEYFIENLLNIRLQGVYFETFKDVVKLPREVRSDKFMKYFNNTCRGIQGLLEGCYFIAPHGSVDYYKNGKVFLQEVTEEYRNVKKSLIKGILSECKNLHKNNFYNVNPPQGYMEEICERLFFNPSLESCKTINEITHNSCGYEYSIINYNNNNKFNETDYKRSFWKQGYNVLNSETKRLR